MLTTPHDAPLSALPERPASAFSFLHGVARWELAFLLIGTLGLCARLALAACSFGCDDAVLWNEHAHVILKHGVRYAYEQRESYNHPPLMGYWSALALALSGSDRQQFSFLLKVPALLGELASALIVYRVWRPRGALAAARAFAGYGLSLPAIFVSAYHGNTDAAYAALGLLAVYWMATRRRAFASGATLAAALNVKLMPVFLVLPLLVRCRSLRDAARFAAGLSLGVLPYLPFLVTCRSQMYHNMIAYNSVPDAWGINAFLDYAKAGRLAEVATALQHGYVPRGRVIIALAVAAMSIASLSRRRWTGYDVGALTWALFLVLTPGFGLQYAMCVVPLLFAASLRAAIVYSLTTGAFLFIMYTERMQLALPLQGSLRSPYPSLAVLFGLLGWASLVRFIFDELRPAGLLGPSYEVVLQSCRYTQARGIARDGSG